MAIHTSFLGATIVSGDEAKAFTRKLATRARVTNAASEALSNGRKMVAAFAKKGSVTVKLAGTKRSTTLAK
jgi:hypothetical protein